MAGLFWCALASLLVLAQALTFDLATPSKLDGPNACGSLICFEDYKTEDTATGTKDSSGGKVPVILHLKIYKVETGKPEPSRHEIASVTTKQPGKAYGPHGTRIRGRITAGKAELRLYFVKHEDCEAGYSCESLALDSNGHQLTRSAQIQGHSNDWATKQLMQLIKQLGSEVSSVKSSLETLEQGLDHLNGSFLTKSDTFGDTPELPSTQTLSNLFHGVTTPIENRLHEELHSLENEMNASATEIRNVLGKSAAPDNTTLKSKIRLMFTDAHRPEKCLKGMASFSRYTLMEPSKKNGYAFPFPCDTQTDGGGWVVFQRRKYGNVDFYRGWNEYKDGFGSFSGDFWLGNENIHSLTSSGKKYELRIDLIHHGTEYFSQYDSFSLGDEQSSYTLHVNGYHGTGGDSLAYYHDGRPFSTYDRDHDTASYNCAHDYHGAWWYKKCHTSNLNGKWKSKTYGVGLRWASLTDKSDPPYMSYSEMKIRLTT